jgi:hypothetical protein
MAGGCWDAGIVPVLVFCVSFRRVVDLALDPTILRRQKKNQAVSSRRFSGISLILKTTRVHAFKPPSLSVRYFLDKGTWRGWSELLYLPTLRPGCRQSTSRIFLIILILKHGTSSSLQFDTAVGNLDQKKKTPRKEILLAFFSQKQYIEITA